MSGRLVDFSLQNGGSVLIEVRERPGEGLVTRGLSDEGVSQKAHQTFERAVERLRPAADAILSQMRSATESPDEIQVEFGVEMSAEAGAFIASMSTAATFRISVTWRSPAPTAKT
jgi:hypothetical protein